LPSKLKVIAAKYCPYVAALSSLGRYFRVDCEYTLTSDGKIKRTKYTYKLMVPSNLKSVAKKFVKLYYNL